MGVEVMYQILILYCSIALFHHFLLFGALEAVLLGVKVYVSPCESLWVGYCSLLSQITAIQKKDKKCPLK